MHTNYTYELIGYQENNTQKTDVKFIRIFRDETNPDLWASYCMGLGISNPEEVKSFKIYIESPDSVEIDEYNAAGEIINN